MVVVVDDPDVVSMHRKLYGRVNMLNLKILCWSLSVRHHNAIQAKRLEIGLIVKITTIVNVTILIHNTLICPIPDEASKHAFIWIDFIPIVLEVTESIPHTVGIFTCHHRAIIILSLCNLQKTFPPCIFRTFCITSLSDTWIQVVLLHTRIKTADDIYTFRVRITLSPFIMYESGRVEFPQPGSHCSMVCTISTLITETPEGDTGIVFVTFCHTDGAIHKSCIPVWCWSKRAAQSVSLTIRFVHHVETEWVAEFIPAWYIGIVGETNGIDIRSLHQHQILNHQLFCHHSCLISIMLMTVYTPQTNRSSGHQQFSILYLKMSETNLLSHLFADVSLRITKL